MGGLIFLFILSFTFRWLYIPAQAATALFALLVVTEFLLLYRNNMRLHVERITTERWSNGDPNPVSIYLENKSPLSLQLTVIDELPPQFQERELTFKTSMQPWQQQQLRYDVRPVTRGVYEYGMLNVFLTTLAGLAMRRMRFAGGKKIAVYPSYIQLRKFELLAASHRLQLIGIKRVRRIGNTMEFDQIKEYVHGDDYRTINWKATARATKLMVNQYIEERAQHVYSLIDMGRVMKMPFEAMTLLDYAINASLVLSNIAMQKEDRPGVITFSSKIHAVLPAEKRANQMHKILELLYAQQTDFAETDFEKLYSAIRHKLTQRSLLLLFTNFESLNAMQRQLPYLIRLAQNHLLLVIFFENTELKKLTQTVPKNTEQIYVKTIGEKFAYEKRLIVKELERAGIYALLTTPAGLTVNTLNKYLEFKALGLI